MLTSPLTDGDKGMSSCKKGRELRLKVGVKTAIQEPFSGEGWLGVGNQVRPLPSDSPSVAADISGDTRARLGH